MAEQDERHLGLAPQDGMDPVGEYRHVVDGPLGTAILPAGVLDGYDVDSGAERR
jgi:hypothetical protein